jgi:hypothetical protein
MSIPVNDHRADLSVAQHDWPRKTLENEEGSPLLVAAAVIRGFTDILLYLVQEYLLHVADLLELLDTSLERKVGKKYWRKMKLKAFEPKSE